VIIRFNYGQRQHKTMRDEEDKVEIVKNRMDISPCRYGVGVYALGFIGLYCSSVGTFLMHYVTIKL
jgi:hypothetical protein